MGSIKRKVPDIFDDESEGIEPETTSAISDLLVQIRYQIDANPSLAADNQLKKILRDACNHTQQNVLERLYIKFS